MIFRISLLICGFSILISAKAQNFSIEFHQQELTIQPDSLGRVYLKKLPFEVYTTLDHLDGVFINCSQESTVYYGALQGQIPDFEKVGWKVSVEAAFNEDRELFIQSQDSYCYWFYDPKNYDWHRFDPVIIRKGKVITGTKQIIQFYQIEEKRTIPVSDIVWPLYLSCFSVKGSFKEKNAVLNQVQTFQLIFKD
jgi:hypothetical protein